MIFEHPRSEDDNFLNKHEEIALDEKKKDDLCVQLHKLQTTTPRKAWETQQNFSCSQSLKLTRNISSINLGEWD